MLFFVTNSFKISHKNNIFPFNDSDSTYFVLVCAIGLLTPINFIYMAVACARSFSAQHSTGFPVVPTSAPIVTYYYTIIEFYLYFIFLILSFLWKRTVQGKM
jgi:hypothetical protein